MRDTFEKKLNPGFVEMAAAYKELANAADELKKRPMERAARRKFRARILAHAIERFTAAIPKLLEVKPRMGQLYLLGSDGSESEDLLCWLCYMAYRKPMWKLAYEVLHGDPDSCRQYSDLCKEWKGFAVEGERFRSKFKIKLDHYDLFWMGTGAGLENLSQTELVEFFDEYCPLCDSAKGHDERALKQNYERFKRELQSWEPDNEEQQALFTRLLSLDRAATPTERVLSL